jgi:hypothetical protein
MCIHREIIRRDLRDIQGPSSRTDKDGYCEISSGQSYLGKFGQKLSFLQFQLNF